MGVAGLVPPPPGARGPSRWVLAAWTLVLFGIWSNSFIAIGFLLGSEEVAARYSWTGLVVGRFLPTGALAFVGCLLVGPRVAAEVVRRRWRRLLLCGLFAVPGYHFALYYGQAHGIPPPIASLETALAPLFLVMIGAFFLREPLSARKVLSFVVALGGLVLIAHAKDAGPGRPYALLVAVTALAPLSWSLYSALSKPASRDCPPVLWAYLALVAGTLPLVPFAPFTGGPETLRLDGAGWAALLFLVGPCTIFGNAAWTWLVKHLPASTVGFTIFLNPPLTTASKALLATLVPTVFAFRIVPLEWVGGGVVLLGMAGALLGPRPAPVPGPKEVPPSGE